jgi:hypothetical protein
MLQKEIHGGHTALPSWSFDIKFGIIKGVLLIDNMNTKC